MHRSLYQGPGAHALATAGMLAVIMLATLTEPLAREPQLEIKCDERVNEGDDATCKFRTPWAYNYGIRYSYRTEDGTARAGQDYQAKQGYMVISAGSRSAELSIRTFRDDVADEYEEFQVELFNIETRGYAKESWVKDNDKDGDGWVSGMFIRGFPEQKTVRFKIK